MMEPTETDGSISPQEWRFVERLQQGDEQAFGELVDVYAPRLYRFALTRLGGDTEAAAEVLQSTLIDVVHKLHTFKGRATFFTWLCACSRNQIRAWFRQRQSASRWQPLDANDPKADAVLQRLADEAATPEETAQQKQLIWVVHWTLDQLPEHYGDVLKWKYLDDVPVREIADRLDISQKAVESRLTRARLAFRQCLTGSLKSLQGENLGMLKP